MSLVGTALFYYPPPKPHAVAHIPKMQLLKELDYLGMSSMATMVNDADDPRLLLVRRWPNTITCRPLPWWQYQGMAPGQRHHTNHPWGCGFHRLLHLGVRGLPKTAIVPRLHLQEGERVYLFSSVWHSLAV